jgi:ubiquinone biosynthesis protein COQ9
MAEKMPPKKKPASPGATAPEEEKMDGRLKAPHGDETLKEAVLAATLTDAAFDGFTNKVLAKAGKTAGLDQDALARLFPDGPVSLIEFYSHAADAQMQERLAAMDLPGMKIRERIAAAVLARLSVLKPHKEAARRAAAALSLPMHAALAARLLYRSVDAMWRAAGDTSTDFNFYTKRGILAGVYGATLLRWFNDASPDESATSDFLAARIENVMQFEKFKAEAKKALAKFPGLGAWGKKEEK